MQDYQRRIENEKRLREAPKQQLPSLNLTLKEGETITVDIKTGGSGSNFGLLAQCENLPFILCGAFSLMLLL